MAFPRPQLNPTGAFLLLALACAFCGFGSSARADTPPKIRVLTVEGPIGPALADFLIREIETAGEAESDAVVLQLNTPGGLVTSMRSIVEAILASPVPVLCYIAPEGAHAASAGTYIFYACHVAAMAPGTNLGAATPIEMGGGKAPPKPVSPKETPGDESPARSPLAPDGAADLKAVNDLVALLRSLAERRGRNPDWAERAVREAAALSARQAVAEKVADLEAPTLEALLDGVHGRSVEVKGKTIVLQTRGASIDHVQPPWVTRLLLVISDPNIAFILMTLGMYGLIFELSNPGAVLPGLLGGIFLILGLYALSVLPVNAAGAGLLLLGVVFMIAEAMAPGIGILGVGGVICFGLGALFLIESDVPGLSISWQVAVGTAVLSGVTLLGLIGYALGTHRRKVTTGREEMIGAGATVLEWTETDGFVFAEGERWRAKAAGPLSPGERVIIKAVDGLVLFVERASTAATRS